MLPLPTHPDTLGVQTIRWQAQDGSGNTAQVAIEVEVVEGTVPEIILKGPITLNWEAGVPYVDPGGRIQDPFEGDLSRLLEDTPGDVDVTTPGTYTVTYFMKGQDVQGLIANQKTRTVIVADTIKPVIIKMQQGLSMAELIFVQLNAMLTPSPSKEITLEQGTSIEVEAVSDFIDPGYSAFDSFEKDVTAKVEVDGVVR